MATTSFVDETSDGQTITKTKYSVDVSGMGYSTISEEIKSDFDFLTTDMLEKIEEALDKLKSAKEIIDAFEFNNGTKVNSIEDSYSIISSDVSNINELANTLRNALRKDIDNVNDELGHNYGWPIFANVKETSKTTEEVPDTSK